MMIRRFKKPVIGALAVGAVALTLAGGTAMAYHPAGDGEGRTGIAERVAVILGLDEQESQDLKDAFVEARGDIQEEAIEHKLQGLVEKEIITQEEADEYLEWYEAKPEGAPLGFGFAGKHGRFGKSRIHPGRYTPNPEAIEQRLDKAVEEGKMSQEDADDYLGWIEAKPDTFNPSNFIQDKGRGRGFGHGRFGDPNTDGEFENQGNGRGHGFGRGHGRGGFGQGGPNPGTESSGHANPTVF